MRSLLPLLLVVTACAPDLRDDHPFDGQTSDGPLVVAEVLEGGGHRLRIDATSKGAQVYVDLDEAKELKAEEAFTTNAWDLWFKRFEVGMNGGDTSPGGPVRVAVLKDVDYAALTTAPTDGYLQDTADKVFAAVEGGWYYYDLGVHRLIPRPELTYVVQGTAGAYFKLKMLAYYDESGTPAALTVEYAPIAAP
jgi:hypothetical protein